MDAGNGGPLKGLEGYLKEIDSQDDELDTLRAEYMNACKGPRSIIKDIMGSAREAELNMKAFRTLVHKHRAERRHEKRLAGLDLVDQSAFHEMVDALGEFADTPLGNAAVQRAKTEDADAGVTA
jgi:hypothetical protein